jgi:hypothetical protein
MAMPAQTPTTTPPLATPTTTPAAQPPQIPTLIPLDILPLVVGALASVAFMVLLLYVVLRRVGRHPFASRIGSWLTSPSVDVLVLGLDPYTREARLFPCKKVGSLYVSTEELAYVVPVGEGENYILANAGKPLIVALKYGRFGAQWVPSLAQTVSLALTPVTVGEGMEHANVRDLMERLVSEISAKISQVTGEVHVGNITLYITTNTPKALEEFMKYVSYAVSAEASVISAAVQAVEAEGARVLEAQSRLILTKRTSLLIGIAVVVLIAAVAVVLLKMAGVI